jgi:excisionase family DNA binding protein
LLSFAYFYLIGEKMSTSGRLLKPKEASLILNVDRRTIWKWIREGKLQAIKLPGGQYRIPEGEIVKILRGERV